VLLKGVGLEFPLRTQLTLDLLVSSLGPGSSCKEKLRVGANLELAQSLERKKLHLSVCLGAILLFLTLTLLLSPTISVSVSLFLTDSFTYLSFSVSFSFALSFSLSLSLCFFLGLIRLNCTFPQRIAV
jgi:hypothetical protein